MKRTFLLLVALALRAHGGTISVDITGTLGPLLAGIDPLGLSGQSFTATGSFDQSFLLVGSTADSATYTLPGNLQVDAGALYLTGYNGTLTVTAPPSGPDTLLLAFSIIDFSLSPQVFATVSLLAGILDGAGIQDFSAAITEPDSNLLYEVLGNSAIISGELGMTGSASISGAGESTAPEPATTGLCIVSLLTIAWLAREKLA